MITIELSEQQAQLLIQLLRITPLSGTAENLPPILAEIRLIVEILEKGLNKE